MPYDAEFSVVLEEFHANGVRKHIKWNDGEEHWTDKNGKRHRIDGPAIILPNNDKLYYLHGKFLKDVNSDEELIIKLLLE